MDTEKYAELEKKLFEGRSPTDEGPYYHHAFWEAYKGSIKGKLGGVIIGAVVGAIVGGVVAAALPLIMGGAALTGGIIATTIGGFAAAGMIYGEREFSDIGIVSGAVAATQDHNEIRMKSFEEKKFDEMHKDIAELKALVKGDKPAATPQAGNAEASDKIDLTEKPYRTTHYAKLEGKAENKYMYLGVTLIGLAVGLAAGALLAYSGMASGVLDGLITAGGPLAKIGITAASMASLGAVGASFGINRDIFRKIFDTTDLWFNGMLSHEKVKQQQISEGQRIEQEIKMNASAAQQPEQQKLATFVSYEGNYPPSPTFHQDQVGGATRKELVATAYRDRIIADAEKALMGLDHTTLSRH